MPPLHSRGNRGYRGSGEPASPPVPQSPSQPSQVLMPARVSCVLPPQFLPSTSVGSLDGTRTLLQDLLQEQAPLTSSDSLALTPLLSSPQNTSTQRHVPTVSVFSPPSLSAQALIWLLPAQSALAKASRHLHDAQQSPQTCVPNSLAKFTEARDSQGLESAHCGRPMSLSPAVPSPFPHVTLDPAPFHSS